MKAEDRGTGKEITIQERMKQEEQVTERTDEKGNRWQKLYFGGGAHFKNWLEQCEEIYGSANLRVEEINPTGFKCFEEGGERVFRIWVKKERK